MDKALANKLPDVILTNSACLKSVHVHFPVFLIACEDPKYTEGNENEW